MNVYELLVGHIRLAVVLGWSDLARKTVRESYEVLAITAEQRDELFDLIDTLEKRFV